MTFLIPTMLLIQYFVSAVYGWHFGFRKGIAASSITILICSVIALLFSGLWIVPIVILLPFLLVASGLGLASGEHLREGRKRIAVVLFSPLLIYWTGVITIEIKKQRELQQVIEFAESSKEVNLAVGDGMTVQNPGAGWTRSKNPFPFKYEVSIKSSKNPKGFYAIVEVSRSWWGGSPTFSLACVTPLSIGERDFRKDVCKQ